jgi:NAD(P)-dependent dehydrogenase (short-subunit alcohol dehydrogenase family)
MREVELKRTAVITGVAGGIGSATAEVFSAAGWRVVGIDRRKPGRTLCGVETFIEADISEPDALGRMYEQIGKAAGDIAALINNAAIQVCKPIIETSVEEWDAVMASNIRSVFLGVKAAYPLLSSGGAIVNVSSVHALATSPNIAAYAASKGALLAFTRALALEFADRGIRVNAVLPGAVHTQMLLAGLERGHVGGSRADELVSALGAKHVLGRVGSPHEIGEAILFLADSSRSSFVTGQALVVDGGALARLSTE